MQDNDALVVPFFRTEAVEDKAASKEAGRPIFRNVDMVEVRLAGERNYAPVFPVNDMWMRINGEEITYAMRFKNEYARFLDGKEQIADGTPLSELPFLTEAKRAELRGLKIYTAEALASLDGKSLKALGGKGRELKNQATAYLEKSGVSASSGAMAAEIEALRAEIAAMKGQPVDPAMDTVSDDSEKETLKSQIAEITGSRPKGNPSAETLREMLGDLKESA